MATQDTLMGSNEARTLYIVRSPEAELAHLWIDKVPYAQMPDPAKKAVPTPVTNPIVGRVQRSSVCLAEPAPDSPRCPGR